MEIKSRKKGYESASIQSLLAESKLYCNLITNKKIIN